MDDTSTTTDTVTDEQVTYTDDTPVTGQAKNAIIVNAPESAVSAPYLSSEYVEDAPADDTTGLRPIRNVLIGFEKMGWFRGTGAPSDNPQRTALYRVEKRQFATLLQRMFRQFMNWWHDGVYGYHTGGTLGYKVFTPARYQRNQTQPTIKAEYEDRTTRVLQVEGLRLSFDIDQWNRVVEQVNSITMPKSVIPLDGQSIEVSRTWTAYHSIEIEDIEDVIDGLEYEVVENPDTGERFAVVDGTEREVEDLLMDAVYEYVLEEDTPANTWEFDEFEEESSDIANTPDVEEYDADEHGKPDDE